MAALTLPSGWRVEFLGIINAVQFTGPSVTGLLWTDGKWFQTHGTIMAPVSSLPYAKNQKEARKIGTEFLLKVYAED